MRCTYCHRRRILRRGLSEYLSPLCACAAQVYAYIDELFS